MLESLSAEGKSGFHLLMLEPEDERELLNQLPAIRKYIQVVNIYEWEQCWVWIKPDTTKSGLPSLPDKPRLSLATRILRLASGNPDIVGFPMCGNLKCLRPSHLATPRFCERYLKSKGVQEASILKSKREGRLMYAARTAHNRQQDIERTLEMLRLHYEEGWGIKRLMAHFNLGRGSVQDIIKGKNRKEEYKSYWLKRKTEHALEIALLKEAKNTTKTIHSNRGMNVTRRRTTNRELPYRTRQTGEDEQTQEPNRQGYRTADRTELTETGRRINTIGLPQAPD